MISQIKRIHDTDVPCDQKQLFIDLNRRSCMCDNLVPFISRSSVLGGASSLVNPNASLGIRGVICVAESRGKQISTSLMNMERDPFRRLTIT